jgi:hypothetical protein
MFTEKATAEAEVGKCGSAVRGQRLKNMRHRTHILYIHINTYI